jgi:glycosyltransferase involved in cell wall biosynthesis
LSRGISIIICCYNSEDKIGNTLRALALQEDYIHPWEIILVDNASTDNTADLARNTWTIPGVPLTIAEEKKPGLMHARLKGLQFAKYPVISFIDDDNEVENLWLKKVDAIMNERPDIGACGGRSIAKFEGEPPVWFPQFESSYAAGKQMEKSGYVENGKDYLWGAGLSIRRTALEQLTEGNFHFLLTGRKNNELLGGEDTEICMCFKLLGYKLWYQDDLTLKHFMPASRLSTDKLMKMNFGFGRSWVFLDIYDWLLHPEKKLHPGWSQVYAANLRTYYRARIKLLSVQKTEKLKAKAYLEFLRGYLFQLKLVKYQYDDLRSGLVTYFKRQHQPRL